MTRVRTTILVSTLVALSGTARAQSAEAEVLFRDGRALIKAHKVAEGCAKLAASDRIESSVGTLLNLGDCRETLGQHATAWAAFKKAEAAARRAGNDESRQKEARRRADRLEPKLATLAVSVIGAVPGEVVERDGELIDEATWGTALPIDPGTIAIVAVAPNHVAWRGSVKIDTVMRHQVVAVPPLVPAPVLEPAPTTPRLEPAIGAPVMVEHPRPIEVRTHRTWSALRGISVGLGLAGIGAVATGAYLGVQANDLGDRADTRCPLNACADPAALRWASDAHTDAQRANALYIGGGAAIAAATVLWIVGRPSDEVVLVPTASGDRVGLALVGSL